MPKNCLDYFLHQWTLHGLSGQYFAYRYKKCTRWYCAAPSDFDQGWSLSIYDWTYCFLGLLHDLDEIFRLYWRSDVVLFPVVFFENICRFVEVFQHWANQKTGSVIWRKQHTVFAKTSMFWFAVNKPWVCTLPRSLKWTYFIVKLRFRENITPPRLEMMGQESVFLFVS